MRYLTQRHTPATSLVGMLCLATSLLLAVVASPTSAAPPAKPSSEEDCVKETFSDASSTPDITFSNDNGTPLCKAKFTSTVSKSKLVSHDEDEYVVDSHNESTSKDSAADSFALTVFPGKITDAGGGKTGGDEKNKVTFDTFYDHRTRGQDTAKAVSQSNPTPSSSSTSSSDSAAGLTVIITLLIVIAVVGAVVGLVSNTLKKSREQKYLDALGQQPLQANTLIPASQPVAFPSQAQTDPVPIHPSYSPAPQQYQPPYSQGPTPTPPGVSGQYPPSNHNGYGGY